MSKPDTYIYIFFHVTLIFNLYATVANSFMIEGSTLGSYMVLVSAKLPMAALPRTTGRYSLGQGAEIQKLSIIPDCTCRLSAEALLPQSSVLSG